MVFGPRAALLSIGRGSGDLPPPPLSSINPESVRSPEDDPAFTFTPEPILRNTGARSFPLKVPWDKVDRVGEGDGVGRRGGGGRRLGRIDTVDDGTANPEMEAYTGEGEGEGVRRLPRAGAPAAPVGTPPGPGVLDRGRRRRSRGEVAETLRR